MDAVNPVMDFFIDSAAGNLVVLAGNMPPEDRTMFSKAEGYERYLGPWASALAPRFIDFAGVRDGDRVLDVGSGTGALSLALAASMPHSEIVGIDPSAPFIEFARTRTGDPRVRFQVEDAMNLPFADGAFDKSLAQLVFNSIPDPARATQEMRRVTRPGGVAAACVWASGEKNEREQVFWGAAMAVDPTAGARREIGGKFSKAGRLSALWKDGGLKEIEETELAVSANFVSFEDYWLPYLEGQGHGGSYAKGLSRDLQETLRERVRRNILGTKSTGPFSLRAQAVSVRGIR